MFDTSLFAVVIVIRAVVVSDVVRKVFCPRVCIGGEILRSHWLATGIENGLHLAVLPQGKYFVEARLGRLRNTAWVFIETIQTEQLPEPWEYILKCASDRHFPVGRGASAR